MTATITGPICRRIISNWIVSTSRHNLKHSPYFQCLSFLPQIYPDTGSYLHTLKSYKYCTFINLLVFHKKITYKKTIVPTLVITISMFSTLLIALPLLQNTMSLVQSKAIQVPLQMIKQKNKMLWGLSLFYS